MADARRGTRRGGVAAWLLCLGPALAAAQPAPGTALEVALLTFGPGTQIWERFGHNAILVRDRASGAARLYNYGVFDLDQPDFDFNFVRGRMCYRIAATEPNEELSVYRTEGRFIVEQDLNLTPAQRARLADLLAWNAEPQHAQYRYDYFTNNCATRVRDVLDAVLDGQIRAQTIAPSRGFTYRMDAIRLMRPEPLLMLAMDAGLGPFADQRLSFWDESFVPMQLMQYLRGVELRDTEGHLVPLVARETLLNPGRLPPPPDFPPDWIWPALASGGSGAILLLGLAQARAKRMARLAFAALTTSFALVCGLAGVLLLYLWFATDHRAAWRNENLFLLDPLCLALLPTWIGSVRASWQPSRWARRLSLGVAGLAGAALFVKVFPAFPQDNRFWIALLLPPHAALAAIVWRASRSAPARTLPGH
jgi:hypothetical protein